MIKLDVIRMLHTMHQQGVKVEVKPEWSREEWVNAVIRAFNIHCMPHPYSSAVVKCPGMRTFVKVTISKHKFNLEGNAHNYLFNYDWEMLPRKIARNDPAAK